MVAVKAIDSKMEIRVDRGEIWGFKNEEEEEKGTVRGHVLNPWGVRVYVYTHDIFYHQKKNEEATKSCLHIRRFHHSMRNREMTSVNVLNV